MSNETHQRIIIVGGGMVGLALARALSQAEFFVTIVDAAAPSLVSSNDEPDARVSAITPSSRDFLMALGVWDALKEQAMTPVEHMHVWDAVGGGMLDFDAADVGAMELAYIVENRAIQSALWGLLQADPRVELYCPAVAKSLTFDSKTVVLHLASGETVHGALVVGADGAHSWVRDHASILTDVMPYHHQAIIAVIKTEKSHHRRAYQPFLKTGPLGVLPLSNPHQVAIVWSAETAEAERLMALSVHEFNSVLTNALDVRLGVMTCVSSRRLIPLVMRHAQRYVSECVALVGDAAHTLHPLAGQGANLGFKDVACLSQVLMTAHQEKKALGSERVLRSYERQRRSDNGGMLWAMRLLKDCFTDQGPGWVALRSVGLSFLNKQRFLKRVLMRVAR